ncbi:hypothetical protein N9H63_00905 [bacterium]|nr:hypothetical protein [bacterium]
MSKSLIEVLNDMEAKRKKASKALEEVLAQYEKQQQKVEETESSEFKESDYKLWEYLCGDGNIQHLYDHYELLDNGL